LKARERIGKKREREESKTGRKAKEKSDYLRRTGEEISNYCCDRRIVSDQIIHLNVSINNDGSAIGSGLLGLAISNFQTRFQKW